MGKAVAEDQVIDIAGPPLEEQVSPTPWLAIRRGVDVRAAVEECIHRHPGMTADEIMAELAKCGIEVNGILVARQLLERAAR